MVGWHWKGGPETVARESRDMLACGHAVRGNMLANGYCAASVTWHGTGDTGRRHGMAWAANMPLRGGLSISHVRDSLLRCTMAWGGLWHGKPPLVARHGTAWNKTGTNGQ